MLSRHDRGGVFLFASAASKAVLGHEASALLGKPLREVVDAEDAPLIERALEAAAETEEPITVLCRAPDGASAPRYIEICAHGVRHPERGDRVEIHCIVRDVTALLEAAQRDEEHKRRIEILIDTVPGSVWGVWGSDATGLWRPQVVSKYVETLTGYSAEEWSADPDLWNRITHPDDRHLLHGNAEVVFAEGQLTTELRWIRRDGRVIWVENHVRAIWEKNGAPVGMSGVTMDITARKEAEAAQARLRDEMLAELSTPLIPLGDKVVAMPLIGVLDRARAARVVEALLNGVSAARARVAILDITGVPAVDVEVADALVRAARGVRLLGAQAVLTGVRPEVAQAFVTLGTDLQGIVTLSTLQAGVRFAIQRG